MQREGYWDYMARRLREERPMHNSLHLKLDDNEKRKITSTFSEVDILKNEVYQLQESLQNAYKKIKFLNDVIGEQRSKISQLEKQDQLEFNF